MDGPAGPEDERDGEVSPAPAWPSAGAFSRRSVVAAGLAAGVAGVAGAVMGGCRWTAPDRGDPATPAAPAPARSGGEPPAAPEPAPDRAGRLQARPAAPDLAPPPPGVHPLELGSGRDGLLLVPAGYQAGVAAPLVVALHGAGGDAAGGMAPLRDLADAAGLVVVAPAARRSTWDLILDDYGPDVAVVDQALRHVFARISVDTRRIAIEGFSDGASYALSLGLGNGDLFTHCIAFAPGFVAEPGRQGRPRVFVTHGVDDTVLPINRCSRRIVPALRRGGYDVDYREFEGGHVVPPDLALAAVGWLTGRR